MFVKRKFAATVLVALYFSVFTSCGFAEEKAEKQNEIPEAETIVTAGEQTLSDRELLQLLQSSAGGNVMMLGLMLMQSTLAERTEMAEQIADSLLFAEGARLSGLAERDDIAVQLKWQRIQILVEAYINERAKEWNMSDEAIESYYNSHKDTFVQPAGAHVRHILTSSESDATNAILDIYRDKDFAKTAEKFSRDTSTAARGGDLGWIERETMPEPLASEIEKAQLKSLSAPVQTDLGWHIFEVLERRPERQLTLEEVRAEVEQQVQMNYIEEELRTLREQLGVEINKEALENLAGIPAAQKEEPQTDLSDDQVNGLPNAVQDEATTQEQQHDDPLPRAISE